MTGARRVKLQVFRIVTFVVLGAFFLGPIWAMFEFSTRGIGDNSPRTLDAWKSIVTYPDLVAGIVASLELALITSLGILVVLVPTMVWVRNPALLPSTSRSTPIRAVSPNATKSSTSCRVPCPGPPKNGGSATH